MTQNFTSATRGYQYQIEIPEFTDGTEKQIAWAQNIRNGYVQAIINESDTMSFDETENRENAEKYLTQIARIFDARLDAEWWINNRDRTDANTLIKKIKSYDKNYGFDSWVTAKSF